MLIKDEEMSEKPLLNSEDRAFWEENGYVVIPNVVSETDKTERLKPDMEWGQGECGLVETASPPGNASRSGNVTPCARYRRAPA